VSLIEVLQRATAPGVVVPFVETDMARHLRDVICVAKPGELPLAVAYPTTTDEVSAVLRICDAQRIPVVPQGGMTGHAGGAVPGHGCVVLALERMNKIEEVDARAGTMTVQAGALLQSVQEAAALAGLTFGLDIGGRGSCHIGGNIATNAGGNQVIRYGTMRQLILGLETVLADGTIVSSMNSMLKNNAGYDLKHLFIGSEGTLGVVTRAVLRLHPKMRHSATALCALRDYAAVEQFLVHTRQQLGNSITSFEVMWSPFYSLVTEGLGRQPPLPLNAGVYVIVEASGNDEVHLSEDLEKLIAEELDGGAMSDAVIAQSERQRADIWRLRESTTDMVRKIGPVMPFDISIPMANTNAFVERSERELMARWPGSTALFFGHLGDSNLHLAFRTATEPQPDIEAETLVYGLVQEFAGSISGEHGIGILKRAFLQNSRTAAEVDVMRRIKHALDPNNILNPGKVLEPIDAVTKH
jgi:FAD/FMN-containing dehydrogenase